MGMKRFFSTNLSSKIYQEAVYGTSHINPMKLNIKQINNNFSKNTIFIHDLLSSHKDFINFQDKSISNSTKSNLIFYDMRGHGHSERDTSYLNFDKMRIDLMNTIFEHKFDNLTLVGHGSGGKLAMTIASH